MISVNSDGSNGFRMHVNGWCISVQASSADYLTLGKSAEIAVWRLPDGEMISVIDGALPQQLANLVESCISTTDEVELGRMLREDEWTD